MLHAVIMAGGSGTRFWPESRNSVPKQLLRLAGQRTMIQSTADRLQGLVPPERVLVATNAALVEAIAEQLPELPRESLLGEPCKRDTAPCIGLAALQIVATDPEGIMAVMPSDHVISPMDRFQEAIRSGERLVEEQPGRIVTYGIRPSYPAESFGYIEAGEALGVCSGATGVYQVKQFREKPALEVAEQYVAAGNFYWNAGIFIWKAQTILDALREHQPEMYAHLEAIQQARGTDQYQEVLEREFAAIKGVSIDYAVMENAPDVVVVEAPFNWDDVGSWQSMSRLREQDHADNTVAANHIGLDTSGTIVRGSDDHLIVTLGVKDLIIVHTPDATLVADKSREESIRELVKLMQERGMEQYL